MWGELARAEATLAEARTITRSPAGPRRLGRLFYDLHRHPRRLLISLTIGRELALTGATVVAAALGYRRFGLAGGVGALGIAIVLLPVVRGFAAGAASRRVAAGQAALPGAVTWMLAPRGALAARG